MSTSLGTLLRATSLAIIATAAQGAKAEIAFSRQFDSESAFTSSKIPAPVMEIVTAGYFAAGDDGGHRKVRIATPSPVQPWHKQNTDGSWWQIAEEKPNPRMFGAVGDGITVDRTAIMNADLYAAAFGRKLSITRGIYAANQLVTSVGWDMEDDAWLRFNGTNGQRVLTCSVNNLVFGRLNVDFGGLAPRYGVRIDSNKCAFGRILMKNMTATLADTNGCRGLYAFGNDCVFTDVLVYDFINSGHTQNDSMPQGITTAGASAGNSFGYCYGNNVRALVVHDGSGRNLFGVVQGANVLDNLIYATGTGGHSAVASMVYDGVGSSASALGVRHGANITVDSISINGSGAVCIFFDGAGTVEIGDIVVHDATSAILGLTIGDPLTPTGTIKIGSIKGTAKNSYPFALQSTNGEIGYLSIGEIDLTITLDATFALTNTNSFIRLDSAKGLNLGRCKIDLVLDGYTPTTNIYAQINSALTYYSFIESWRFGVFQSDKVTPWTAFNTLMVGNASTPVAQDKLKIEEGCFTTSGGLRAYTWRGFSPGRLVSDGSPTVGYGRQGEFRFAQDPTASLRGWTCNAAGTPGTWTAF